MKVSINKILLSSLKMRRANLANQRNRIATRSFALAATGSGSTTGTKSPDNLIVGSQPHTAKTASTFVKAEHAFESMQRCAAGASVAAFLGVTRKMRNHLDYQVSYQITQCMCISISSSLLQAIP
ncbi:hypothetical protein BY458DRAFT_491144 [Sporodiniella umbellata]|nr:hypothetical protein BY458DRAFT_491144 [Sporodiniella umbellata]